ncbi:large-conductance mechanosensitive channel protein MscL [Leuconostocaceae bacterium ESL0958]|nr:large-conductance mechanosensitive channel protein MscL [Leuconostocaceae bacterium ESL0958]
MFKDFKDFVNRGNLLDLSVGVIIGTAFTGLVKSTTTNLINPLIGLFTGKSSNLTSQKLVVSDNLVFTYGAFLNDVINFLITAFVVFLLVKFIHKYLIKPKAAAPKKPSDEAVLLGEIKELLEEQNKKQSKSK